MSATDASQVEIERSNRGGAPIDVFFEFASPYSYIAAQRLPSIASLYGRFVRWRPIDLDRVWAGHDVADAAVALRKVKFAYLMRDAARVADLRGIPFVPFKRHPNSRLAKLATHRLNRTAPELAETFVLAAWDRLFVDGGLPTEPAALCAGLDRRIAVEVEAAAEDATAAEQLAEANRAAVAAGCFGVPWVMVDDEPFFGQDRLDLVERRLAFGP